MLADTIKDTFAGLSFSVDRDQLAQQGLLRQERPVGQRDGARVCVDGKWLINFCSNDYLGLAAHPAVIQAMQQAAAEYGTGSAASSLVCGKSIVHQQLEHKIAGMTGRDRALILACGYSANLAIQSALISSRRQSVVQDRLCHASIVDAAVLARSQLKRYRHADPDALERILAAQGQTPALVITESVFSMDGDLAPLPEIAAVCRRYHACLVVDDAHAFGVLGPQGLGALELFSLQQADVPLVMGTFGKAAGVYGAFVAGPDDLIETLVQRARPYIYSTALPVPVIAAASAAIDIMHQESWRREHLQSLINRFRAGAQALGIPLTTSMTPIQPLIIGRPEAALACSNALEQEGIYVRAIRPPTVPQNSSRLRITLSAAHTGEQVDRLLQALHNSMSTAGILQDRQYDD